LRLYALKREAWRIDAYLLLERIASKDQWNAALERLQGSLLGYTDEQNEEWLRKRYQKHVGWACYTLYAVTTRSTLQRIADLGMRAFPTEHPIDIRLLHCFDEIPSRSSVERSGLFRGEYCEMIRFGVKKIFFENGLERVASEGLSTFSIRDGQNMKDLNQALATDIQIVKPH
jgi:hypothetical protein